MGDGRCAVDYKTEIASYFTRQKGDEAICSFFKQIDPAPSESLKFLKKAIDLETGNCIN